MNIESILGWLEAPVSVSLRVTVPLPKSMSNPISPSKQPLVFPTQSFLTIVKCKRMTSKVHVELDNAILFKQKSCIFFEFVKLSIGKK